QRRQRVPLPLVGRGQGWGWKEMYDLPCWLHPTPLAALKRAEPPSPSRGGGPLAGRKNRQQGLLPFAERVGDPTWSPFSVPQRPLYRAKCRQHFKHHALHRIVHLVVPEAQDGEPAPGEIGVARRVHRSCSGCIMLHAVHLDDETLRKACKVDN